MTGKQKSALAESVEQLGDLRAKIGLLEASERDLAKDLRARLEAGGLESAESEHYTAQLAVRQSLTIDPRKFLKRAGEEIFAACARIDAKTARLHFSEEQLAKLGKVTTSTTLRISERPG